NFFAAVQDKDGGGAGSDFSVMAGLSRPSTSYCSGQKTWIPGTSPGMTALEIPIPLNPPPRPLPIGIAQAALEDLAGIFPRQVALDLDVLRHLVVGQRGLELAANFGEVERHPRLRLHHRHQRLAELSIRNAEHRAVMHARDGVQRGLDLGR